MWAIVLLWQEKRAQMSLSSLARTTLGAKPRANISAQDAAVIVHDKEPKERQYRSAFLCLLARSIFRLCVVWWFLGGKNARHTANTRYTFFVKSQHSEKVYLANNTHLPDCPNIISKKVYQQRGGGRWGRWWWWTFLIFHIQGSSNSYTAHTHTMRRQKMEKKLTFFRKWRKLWSWKEFYSWIWPKSLRQCLIDV